MTEAQRRFALVRELFEQAIDDPDAVAGLSATVSGADPEIIAEVNHLLEIHRGGVAHVDESPAAELVEGLDASIDDWTGRRIGQYRVVRELGHGGMGTVYEAVRDDEEYEKRVAIKVIQVGIDSAGIVRRFRRERQILASLDHPNIARLLDGGVMLDGRPYIVMEYVEGSAITDFCRKNRLDVRQRITLFFSICAAVRHAHEKLIVHRDLKPGNILVTNEGIPKLLDFGIAKLVSPEAEGGLSTMAPGDPRFFTPEYASPEQIRDEAITVRSDVYSLGVILYELMSGVQPFRVVGRTAASIERILSTEPRRPSGVVTDSGAHDRSELDAAHLRRHLSGELDNIVLMALRKDPERRYGSVEDLSDDLHRHLDGHPVVAQGDAPSYRARKFLMRHRGVVTAAALIALSLIGGISTSLWKAKEARDAAQRAEIARAQAEQVTKFLVGVIGAANPNWDSNSPHPGASTTVLEAVHQAASRVGAQLAGQPDVEATVRRTLGNTYEALNYTDSAEPQLRMAVELRRKAHAAPTRDLALDLLGLSIVRFQEGNFPNAESLLREAVASFAAAGDKGSTDLANAYGQLSITLTREGKLAGADSFAVMRLALTRQNFGRWHPGSAAALSGLAGLRWARGDLKGSEQYLREAVSIYARYPQRVFPERGVALTNLAAVVKWRGAFAEAENLLAQSNAQFTATGGSRLPESYAVRELAYTHYLAGEPGGALIEIRTSLALLRAVGYPDTHPDVVRDETIEGMILVSLGRSAEAMAILRKALSNRNGAYAAHDPQTAETIGALGLALARMGKRDEAAKLLMQSRTDLVNAFGADDARARFAIAREHAALAGRPFNPTSAIGIR